MEERVGTSIRHEWTLGAFRDGDVTRVDMVQVLRCRMERGHGRCVRGPVFPHLKLTQTFSTQENKWLFDKLPNSQVKL